MLWFGWFGFNAGSALAAGQVATAAFVATNIAAGAAMLGWILIEGWLRGRPTAVGAITGAVAGLVAITPACGFVTPLGAICIGLGVSAVCYWALNQRLKWNLDDTLDAFSVHGVGGIFGALATGVFASAAVNPAGANGLLHGNPRLLAIQAAAVLSTAAFSAAVTWLLLKAIDLFIGIRSPREHENDGIGDGAIGLAVLSGVTRETDLPRFACRPHHVLSNVGAIIPGPAG
jgi:Amt family ammonium transporter